MSPPLVVVNEHLGRRFVTEPLQRFVTAQQIGAELSHANSPFEKGGRGILSDEQIIPFLRSLKRRTFITIDAWFCKSRLCDNAYCLIYFRLTFHVTNFGENLKHAGFINL
jgi:hypothetical protein